ncbi:MAG TPA: histidine kinase, partial [Candidatus Limnocylindrales bacterium]|nr:histidine kinase [Candidatus Limnocylindrales bacterium]
MSDAGRLLRGIEQVNRAITSASHVDGVFASVIGAAFETVGCTAASIMVLDPAGEALVVRAARGGAEIGGRVTPGPSLSWHAMERRSPIILSGRAGAEYATGYTKDVPFSLVGPLVVGAKTLGVLNVSRDGHPGEDALVFLRTLADIAAFAVERFELHEDLQHFTEQLLAQEEEHRRRLARDLHDGLAPLLVSAHAQLQSVSGDDEQVKRATQLLRKAIQETRGIIGSVRPATLDDLGLAGALSAEAQDIAEEAGWTLEAEVEDPGPLSREAESALYRVTIEAL